MEWSLVGLFEFVVVFLCLFSRAYARNITFFKAVRSPVSAEELFAITLRIAWWLSLLSAYLILRIELLTVAAIIGWVFVFLGVFTLLFIACLFLSFFVYTGIWDDRKELFMLWIDLRSHQLSDYLGKVRARYGKL